MTEPRPELDLWEISDSRRIELGKRWKDVLAETGLSHETLNRWRKGYNVDPFTDRSFEKSLRWRQGARAAAADGRHPEPVDEDAEGPDGDAEAVADPGAPTLEEELELAARLMAAQVSALGLSPDEAAEAWRRAQERITRSREAGGSPDVSHGAPRRHRAG